MKRDKKMISRPILTAFLATVASLSATAFALEKGDTTKGGGGDIAADVAGIIERLDTALTDYCSLNANWESKQFSKDEQFCYVGLDKVYSAIWGLKKVLTPDFVTGSDGQPRDAGNNGKDEIIVGAVRWREISGGKEADRARVRLILHEIFVIAQLEEQDSYRVSAKVINRLESTPNKWDTFCLAIISNGAGTANSRTAQSPGPKSFSAYSRTGYQKCAFYYMSSAGDLEREIQATIDGELANQAEQRALSQCSAEGYRCSTTMRGHRDAETSSGLSCRGYAEVVGYK